MTGTWTDKELHPVRQETVAQTGPTLLQSSQTIARPRGIVNARLSGHVSEKSSFVIHRQLQLLVTVNRRRRDGSTCCTLMNHTCDSLCLDSVCRLRHNYVLHHSKLNNTNSSAMAERPRELGDFEGMGQFGAKFLVQGSHFAPTSMDLRWGNGYITTLPLEVFTQKNFVADF